jgi:hypothetical protein
MSKVNMADWLEETSSTLSVSKTGTNSRRQQMFDAILDFIKLNEAKGLNFIRLGVLSKKLADTFGGTRNVAYTTIQAFIGAGYLPKGWKAGEVKVGMRMLAAFVKE